ncbi:MAG: hypothetical protein AB7G23_13410 [Vicinamibacterales bacterium]
MKPWEVIGRTHTPDGTELTLHQHPSGFVIMANGQSLMTSRSHDSEDALAALGCRLARALPRPQVLVGGLGMGFTLRAVLDLMPAAAEVVVVELVPEVVSWNRGPLGPLAGHPLDDPRVRLEMADVTAYLRAHPATFDAVLLDVDNGSDALIFEGNAGLYGAAGLAAAGRALRPAGVLAVWAAGEDRSFVRRLRAAGLQVRAERLRSRLEGGRSRHVVYVAQSAVRP